jgi:uracil-DNA glycosylase
LSVRSPRVRARPRVMPLPHPSWHNTRWLERNPWFEAELVPVLRAEVRALLDGAGLVSRAQRGMK